MQRRSLILLALLVLGFGMAACGGGGEGDTGASETGIVAETGLVETGAFEGPGATEETPPAFQIKVPGVGEAISPQSPSAQIEQLQKALKLLGFEVAIDGQYGPKTVRAVKKFQKQHKLDRDGLVGPKTARAINRALREQAAQAG